DDDRGSLPPEIAGMMKIDEPYLPLKMLSSSVMS
ncbi:hypothetical protein A2U01_0089187, partial [Trifolium medium]|nr:hypothetical protein [Trifolium medium]